MSKISEDRNEILKIQIVLVEFQFGQIFAKKKKKINLEKLRFWAKNKFLVDF